jgi:hypothetical protein
LIKLAILHSCEERGPLVGREDEDWPAAVLAVAYADGVVEVSDLDALPVAA